MWCRHTASFLDPLPSQRTSSSGFVSPHPSGLLDGPFILFRLNSSLRSRPTYADEHMYAAMSRPRSYTSIQVRAIRFDSPRSSFSAYFVRYHCILTGSGQLSRLAEAPRERLGIPRLRWVQNLSKCSVSDLTFCSVH
jgi:hypothetical protein